MREKETLLAALAGLKIQTGSLACLGCEYECNCSIEGCAIIREAIFTVETQDRLLAESEGARSDLGKRLAAALQRADRLMADLKATQSCSPCAHVDTMMDCEGECLECKLECPCRECRDSSNFKWSGDSDNQPPTNGDRLRQRTDEELVELLYQHYLGFSDRDGAEDPSVRWCDMKGGCQGEETSECTDELHKACILRWLRAKDGDSNG